MALANSLFTFSREIGTILLDHAWAKTKYMTYVYGIGKRVLIYIYIYYEQHCKGSRYADTHTPTYTYGYISLYRCHHRLAVFAIPLKVGNTIFRPLVLSILQHTVYTPFIDDDLLSWVRLLFLGEILNYFVYAMFSRTYMYICMYCIKYIYTCIVNRNLMLRKHKRLYTYIYYICVCGCIRKKRLSKIYTLHVYGSLYIIY